MSSFQKITLIGHAGNDPEVRYLESGQVVAKLSIAVSEKYTDKNGHKVDNTVWFRLEAWESIAKIIEKYVYKASMIFVEGKMKEDKWTDKDGIERAAMTVRVSSLTLLGNPNQQTSGSAAPKVDTQQSPSAKNQQRANDPVSPSLAYDASDDLPF